MRTVILLLALLAVPGVATAGSACPSCDPSGTAEESWYSSVDAAHEGEHAGALADGDAAMAESRDERGFWAWLALCWNAWAEKLGELTGLSLGGQAEAYVSQDGVDLDAQVGDVVFDDLPVAGKLDDQTWKIASQTKAELRAHGVEAPRVEGVPTEELPTADVDACTNGELDLCH